MVVLTALYLRGRLVRPLHIRWLAMLALLGLMGIQLMGHARTWRGESSLGMPGRPQSLVELIDPYDAVKMMGSQISAVVRTLTIVPHERPYGMGESYVASARYIIPNLSPNPRVADLTYGAWLTAYTEPDTSAAGGGVGASVVAEAYFNFGLAGALVVLLLVGLASGLFEARAIQLGSPWLWGAFAVWFRGWIWSVRNEAPARTLVWGWLVVLFAWQVVRRRRAVRRCVPG